MNALPTRRTVSLALLLVALLAEDGAWAQAAPSEDALKAAFVFQFLSYVTWPESKHGDGVLHIGVVGAEELADNLAMLSRNESADARAIKVHTVPLDGDPRDLHVLFVDAKTAGAVDALLQTALAGGVLTITESLPRPAHSVINFEIIGSKVRFDVALGLARQNGLDVSGRLLQVALRVIDAP